MSLDPKIQAICFDAFGTLVEIKDSHLQGQDPAQNRRGLVSNARYCTLNNTTLV